MRSPDPDAIVTNEQRQYCSSCTIGHLFCDPSRKAIHAADQEINANRPRYSCLNNCCQITYFRPFSTLFDPFRPFSTRPIPLPGCEPKNRHEHPCRRPDQQSWYKHFLNVLIRLADEAGYRRIGLDAAKSSVTWIGASDVCAQERKSGLKFYLCRQARYI